jgi:hypothetical protein
MRYLAGIALLAIVLLLAGACREQERSEPYNRNLSNDPAEVLLPTAPMDLDASIMNPDAGALPEPKSEGIAEPPAS